MENTTQALKDLKILIVSSSILPYSGGSSVIIENLANQFHSEEMIVLGARGVSLNRISRSSSKPTFHYFFSELSFFGRGARFFNWFRKMRFSTLIKSIEKLIKDQEINYVVGVYPNQFYCLAACRAAGNLGIAFSSYFHNTYVENNALNDPKAESIQEAIFSSSQNIFVMSDGMKKFYQKKYFLDKFIPLRHTFEKPKEAVHIDWSPLDSDKVVKLVCIGNFNESNLEATRRVLEAIGGSDKYELGIYTHVPKILMSKRGLNAASYIHMGSVSPDQIHAELQKYDICILTHGFTGGYGDVEYETIFPTRTIPLLISGRPILAHSPNGSFLNEFIKEHDCAELVDVTDSKEIIRSLDKICQDVDLQEKLVRNALLASKQFEGETVADEFKKHLKVVVKHESYL